MIENSKHKIEMKWDVDETNGVMWIAAEAAKSLCWSMKRKVGICFTEHLFYLHNHNFKWCTLEEENEKIGNFLVDKFKNDKFANKFKKEYRKFDKWVVKELNGFDRKDFPKLSDADLFRVLKMATAIYIKNFDFGFIIEPMDFVMPKLIEPNLINHGYTAEEIAEILAMAEITFINKEERELIRIAKKSKEKQNELLKKHAYNYRWLQSAHMGRKDIPFSYFEDRLKKLRGKDLSKKLENLKNFRTKTGKIKIRILKEKPIDKNTMELLKITDLIAPLHDRRKELFLRSVYTIDTTRIEIARRFGYTKEELSVFPIENLLRLRKNEKLDKKYARNLIKEGLFYINKEKNIWEYHYGKKARKIIKNELFHELKGIKEIKGMPASIGFAKGIVEIIQGTKDMVKMGNGSIIVASMTKPEFLPAVKKAAAIITDEGGVTCHAAIISRELKIPCIIGTKIATKVLKDGQLVEVDANKGVVRIIK